MTRILGLRDPAFLSSIATTGELPAPPLTFMAGGYNGAPTLEGVDLTATIGSAGTKNVAIATYDSNTGDPVWISQITLTTAEGTLIDYRVCPTEDDTVLVAFQVRSDGAGTGKISVNIYNGDTVLAPGAFAGTLHDNWQTDRDNNLISRHGVLIVGFDQETGAVTGWTAINDDVTSAAFGQMELSGINLDGSGKAVVYGRQQVNFSGGVDDWTGAIHSNGVEVDNPFYDSSVVQASWGLTHAGTYRAHVNADGSYDASSFDFSYSVTNASGSLFMQGLTGRKAGNATKFVNTIHASILDGGAQMAINGRDQSPQITPAGLYRTANVIKFDQSTRDVDWMYGLNCTSFPHDRRGGPHDVLVDGSVLAMFWELNSGATSRSHYLTQNGSNVVFNKADPEPTLVRYNATGVYQWHKILATVTNPGGSSQNILRALLVDEDNDRLYIATGIRNGGGTSFTYGNGEANQYAITDAPVSPYYTYVISLHTLSTGDFQWLTEVRDNNVSGSGSIVSRLTLSADGSELYAYGRYDANSSNPGSGVTFGHNAGVGRHGPGSPIALTFDGGGTGSYVGRYVMDPADLGPIRFDQYGPVGVNATGSILWQAGQGVDGV